MLFALIAMPALGTPEVVSVGLYNISFDLGGINHSVTTKAGVPVMYLCGGYDAPAYKATIAIPDHCEQCSILNGSVTVMIVDYSGVVKHLNINHDENGKPPFINVKDARPINIDNLPGWILQRTTHYAVEPDGTLSFGHDENGYTYSGTSIDADYRLEPRGTGATGDVLISGISDNATVPYVMNLIRTLHVTERIIHATYTKEPVYATFPHNTYTTG